MADDLLTGDKWQFLWHGDGSDKNGRFTINGYRSDRHPRIEVTSQAWRKSGVPHIVTYYLDGDPVGSRENAIAGLLANPEAPGDAKTIENIEQEGQDGESQGH